MSKKTCKFALTLGMLLYFDDYIRD